MFFKSIFENFIGYDILIFIVALINLVVIFPKLRKVSMELDQRLNPVISRPIQEIIKVLQISSEEKMDLHSIKRQKEEENRYYQVYITMTSIFPLLGILGTVIAMLTLGDFSSNLVVTSFTKALTSTFWGLAWAIFFKSLEGLIVPYVEQNEENLKLLLYRLDKISADLATEAVSIAPNGLTTEKTSDPSNGPTTTANSTTANSTTQANVPKEGESHD